MKVTKVDNPASGDPITYNPNNMTIANSFNSWHEVPDTYTKVAEYHSNTTSPSTTDTTLGAKLETTYAAYISNTQSADTYTGQVKYTMVHPYDRRAPEAPYFQVFYTGRPASTEPGHENPVKIRMSDLPADGKYNLLGTADGLYDKLTPDTLYGGYYKNIVDSVEDFSYTNEAEYYDGTNFNWLISTPETTDAAAITPENETTYYVKEVNSTRYIRMGSRWTFGGDDIKGFWFFTDLDDENYANAGFYYSDNTVTDKIYLATGLFGSYTITPLDNPANAKAHTAESLFNAYGENNVVAPWQDNQNEVLNDEVESFTVYGFWVTKDGYKVTGRRQLNTTTNGWHNSTISGTFEGIPSTISKWNPIE